MKILNISAQKPNSTGSGIYLTALVNSFWKKGIENEVICGIDKEDHIELEHGIPFHPVCFHTEELPFYVVGMSDLMPYKSTRYKDMTKEMQRQFEEAFIKKIRKVVKEFQPDFILCHHLYFLTALVREYFPDRKVGAVCHNTDLRQYEKIEFQNERIMTDIQNLDVIFSLHEKQKEKIETLFCIDKRKIFTIGAGYNSEIFYKKNYEKKEDIVRIIYAGKISDEKGISCFLEALNHVNSDKKIKFYLAGGYSDENEYEKIRKLASEIKYEVEFLGKLTQEDLAEQFNKADLFVLPSFNEGLPLVLVEALACGLKVVATDLPGIRQWMDQNIKEHQIFFVKPPQMNIFYEIEEAEKRKFIKRLSKETEKAVRECKKVFRLDTSSVSWDSVADKIIKMIKDQKGQP